MIIDKIENWALYAQEGTRLYRAFEYILKTDLDSLALGKHVIEEDEIFAILMEYDTKPVEDCVMEAHKRYLDLQFVVSGVENIGLVSYKGQEPSVEYQEKDDYWLFKTNHHLFAFGAGDFGVFYPDDLHMPGVVIDKPSKVKKLVVKVKL